MVTEEVQDHEERIRALEAHVANLEDRLDDAFAVIADFIDLQEQRNRRTAEIDREVSRMSALTTPLG
jgi:predicted  nucleic acid-binding Zn-ribbon protein